MSKEKPMRLASNQKVLDGKNLCAAIPRKPDKKPRPDLLASVVDRARPRALCAAEHIDKSPYRLYNRGTEIIRD
eukprot:scaffold223459_cov18-Prasinocladus_malaysianus.AAC.2